MRLKTLQGSASSQPEWQNGGSDGSTVRHTSEAGSPLTEEMRRELKALAELSDAEIDFSDIPEWTEEDFRSAVRGGYRQKTAHKVTLALEEDAALWLRDNSRTQTHAINYALKQVVQHGSRAALERSTGSERAIYDESSAAFAYGLELLTGRVAPPRKYVEVPEYSDIKLKEYSTESWPSLEKQAFELVIDDEVYDWLLCCGSSHSLRVNYAIKFLVHQRASVQSSLRKAS